MTDTPASEAARQLALSKPRQTFVCEACGAEYEATVRRDQPNRACSGPCRDKLYNLTRRKPRA